MLPSSFRALRWLERLNVAAVGLSLAAVTSAACRCLDGFNDFPVYVGAPTLLFGTLWARLLRSPRTTADGSVRLGWVLLVPLAAASAALACAWEASVRWSHLGTFLFGLFVGAVFGSVVWGPAVLLTLLFYGLPIAWAQRSARRGLAGQERGEAVVGAVAALMAAAAAALSAEGRALHPAPHGLLLPWFTEALAAGAVACGGLAVVLSVARARRWRDFVAEVEAGRVERYRIETTDEGRTLVRVARPSGNYRATDVTEEIAALDDDDRERPYGL